MGRLDDVLMQRLMSLDRADFAALLEFLQPDVTLSQPAQEQQAHAHQTPVKDG